MTSSSVLLVSGAGLPEWIWEDTRAALPGTSAVAPRPAHGGDVAAYARAALAAAPEGPLTLVAHSAGGVVGAQIAALAPDRVRGVLAVSAVVPPAAGGSFASSMPMPNRAVLPVLLRLAGTRPPEKSIRGSLAAGVPEPVADRIVRDFRPEPRDYFLSRTSGKPWAAQRGYVFCTEDTEFPLALQQRFAARLDPTFTGTLTAGHLPMLQAPAELARLIVDFRQQADAPAG